MGKLMSNSTNHFTFDIRAFLFEVNRVDDLVKLYEDSRFKLSSLLEDLRNLIWITETNQ